ncbi:putative bifunctional diguanylate cyclase/phosphodiesterase [Cognaticolwellia mytili]|uniref:putative bifunctional diguanylate cyclase/phosphodiesterase n=1 Tax=Cognaticolwellia mytili TaxID=1888913 RepID=UPI000A17863F|nr:GGDEF domain-containing phosphodiesterase [Cognaticolwellia mytili]
MNEHRIKAIIKSISNINNDNFFDEICLSLSRAINADFVFIATINDTKTNATSLAVANKGCLVDNFTYPLKSTPCAEVVSESICTYSCNVQNLYPDDELLVNMKIDGYVGIPLKTSKGQISAILVALFEDAISDVHEVETLFLLFSGLIEKELHKCSYLKAIEFTNNIIENAHEAIVVCDKNQRITYINPSFTRMTGYDQADLQGKTPRTLSSGKQSKAFYQTMWLDLNTKGHWQGEIWNKRKDGHEYLEWLSITAVVDKNNELTHYTAFFTDITEQYIAKEKIKFHDSYDTLTRAANKKSLFTFIDRSIVQYTSLEKSNSPAALLVINIDLFKKFNSLYSHDLGDKVLIYVANRLKELVRDTDIVSRTTGDNFSIFINGLTNKKAAINVVNSINSAFMKPFIIDDINIKITLSIGIAFFKEDAQNAHGLFEKAEQAMFVAKDNGRNSYEFYSQELSDIANMEEAFKLSLESAIENDEFSNVYQPIVSLKNKSVNKFEVLARWKHNGDYISPAEFIPIAEKFGLISKIGNLVLNKACSELKRLNEMGFTDVVFNINRSIYEFSADGDHTSWLDTINSYHLAPKNVCFELTESVLAPENDRCIKLLNTLKIAGCPIALDDFGTGYSSLSYLRRFPIDTLKIDRSFISEMTKVEGDVVLVSAIISMAKALGISVVAEGVELKQEVDILVSLGCDDIQGYYFSKPIAAGSLSQYLVDFKYCE